MKKVIFFVAASAVLVLALIVGNLHNSSGRKPMRDISTMELVRDMGIGINLGNTYDS